MLFLLEHAHANPPFLEPGFAQSVVFIPDIEWMMPADVAVLESGKIDTVAFKNQFSLEIFNRQPVGDAVRHRPVIGWTSVDFDGGPLPNRNFHKMLHVRGVSQQKSTEVVLDVWLHNPDFPELTATVSLREGFRVDAPLRKEPNLTLLLGKIPEEDLRKLQLEIGIHVCPSMAEGFGHSLNEARAAGAVLVTTDAPPMNDLVTDGVNGYLVPSIDQDMRPFNYSVAYPVRRAHLEQTIRKIMSVPVQALQEMGGRARLSFVEDRARFYACVRSILEDVTSRREPKRS